MDLIDAEDIKKVWQEYTEEQYKKDLHDPEDHDGVINDLEQDKWALNVKSRRGKKKQSQVVLRKHHYEQS